MTAFSISGSVFTWMGGAAASAPFFSCPGPGGASRLTAELDAAASPSSFAAPFGYAAKASTKPEDSLCLYHFGFESLQICLRLCVNFTAVMQFGDCGSIRNHTRPWLPPLPFWLPSACAIQSSKLPRQRLPALQLVLQIFNNCIKTCQ